MFRDWPFWSARDLTGTTALDVCLRNPRSPFARKRRCRCRFWALSRFPVH
jgi:hypothetical protein